MTRVSFIYATILLAMPLVGHADGKELTEQQVEQKVRHAIQNAKFEGTKAVSGKITKVEALCGSSECTAANGMWTIMVDDKLEDGLDQKSTMESALLDLEAIDQAVYKLGIQIDWVDYQGKLTLSDKYGNDVVATVISGRLLASDGTKINWKHMDSVMCWNLQTQAYVHPAMTDGMNAALGND